MQDFPAPAEPPKYTIIAFQLAIPQRFNIMGAVPKIFNAMEDAKLSNSTTGDDVPYSSLTVDASLSLPEMTPRVMFVSLLRLSVPFLSLSFFSSVMV